jgi:Cft2 family RNA processing exonuclease
MRYADNVRNTVKKVFLVHGEAIPAAALTEKLKYQNIKEVYYPALHSSVEI